MTSRTLLRAVVVGSVVSAFAPVSQGALLSYWNFNNVSPGYLSGNGTLGSFNTTAAVYGEQYVQTNNSTAGSLRANSANGALFSGPSIKIDFSNLATATQPIINGKTFVSTYTSQGQTSTTLGGYGTFADDTTNRAAGDTTTGGSMIIMDPSDAVLNKSITFSLSSAGYNTLSLTYADRKSAGKTATEVWSYSLNGTTFTTLTSITPTDGAFGAKSLNLSSLTSNAVNNQSAFYLRMTIGTGNSASYAFDNIQLTGTAVPIPEPGTLVSVVGFAAVGMLSGRRRARGTR